MIKSSYSPQTWNDVKAAFVKPNVIGIPGSVTNNTTQNTDVQVLDDSLIRGIKLLAIDTLFGDTISVKVVDVDGIYSPAGTVLSSPILNFNVSSDQQVQADYESVAPFKILGGLYIRITYTSINPLPGTVKFGANISLVTVLQ